MRLHHRLDVTQAMANPTVPVHERAELRIFYGVVLILALFGQSSGASSWLIPPDANPLQLALYWGLVLAFVAVLELGAVVLLRRAETQRRAGERAWVAIFTAIALALGAAALSWAGHWGPEIHEQLQAWAFAGSTLLGVIVWAIMADLRIAEDVAQHRAVRDAVRRYIRALTMDGAEKAVLIATMNIPVITKWIIDGPESAGESVHDRDVRIARILATAIDPDTWYGHQLQIETPAVEPAPVAEPSPPQARAVPKPRRAARPAAVPEDADERDRKFATAWRELLDEYAAVGRIKPPSCRELGDRAGFGKSTAAKWIKSPTLEEVSA
jgi:hypothetical protein